MVVQGREMLKRGGCHHRFNTSSDISEHRLLMRVFANENEKLSFSFFFFIIPFSFLHKKTCHKNFKFFHP